MVVNQKAGTGKAFKKSQRLYLRMQHLTCYVVKNGYEKNGFTIPDSFCTHVM